MKLYRFSPIQNKQELLQAIKYIHFACHQLCKQSVGKYLPIGGNMGVFCHYDNEYKRLIKIRQELAQTSANPNQKYYRLHKPIVIRAQKGIPKTTYTHIYIRRPDPYRHHVGDVDFYLSPQQYLNLKQSLRNGKNLKGIRTFDRLDLDMIEMYDPDIDALGYISTKRMAEKVRLKQSEATKL